MSETYEMSNKMNEILNPQHSISRSPSPAPLISLPAATEQQLSPQDLQDWINIPDLTSHDLTYIDERRHVSVPADEQARGEQLIYARIFQDWLVFPTSSQLLVHGNYYNGGSRLISGLSLFSSSFAKALAEKTPRFLRLMFFCGLHEDSLMDDHTGGRALIQTFICQLLCQYDFGEAGVAGS
ncbi:hypothetical protein B0T17DRAFT_648512 [Bombardia bombarda]|uniref:Uncharacterized protein n=1 Tax=Bombardia bombarda TaxID=252184 RepID=A0AA39TI93_9PEZI|nr:hypothetical protein B0T17DRAFT_648512 [Bombardia bombarda]